MEEGVDGSSCAWILRRDDPEDTMLDREQRSRRDHVDVIGLGTDPVVGPGNRYAGVSREELDEQAWVAEVEVLHHHERDPGVRRYLRQELLEGFETARGCSDS